MFGLITLFTLGGCGLSHKLDPSLFRHWIIDPHPNTGRDCCTDVLMLGDINGNGGLDIVIGAEHAEGAGLVWYQYPTWEKHPVANGQFTTDGQLADVDGDGDLDIVIGTFSNDEGEIVWFENISGTGQGEWTRHLVGRGYAHDLEVGDVDGDGRLDIVSCDKNQVVLWLQTKPGQFERRVILKRQGEGIALADIDGDGDLDIVFGGSWLENPGAHRAENPWKLHAVAPGWAADTRVFVTDMNGNGRPDVVLSVSEGKGPISWFESPGDIRAGVWVEHPVEKGVLEGVHSLQVADFDGDGKPDVLAAEMHTTRGKRVRVYFNRDEGFVPMTLSRNGSHNMRVGDIDGDGDIDIVGKNYAGRGRVIEMWENLTSDTKKWTYIPIDGNRPKSQKGKTGLVFSDVDRDGYTDVIAGSFVYRNPGGNLQAPWQRTLIADERTDVFFAVAAESGSFEGLVGMKENIVYWIEPTNGRATAWKTRPVGQLAAEGRTQGYIQERLVPGKRRQLVFTRGKNLYVLVVPDDLGASPWPLFRISTEVEEEGIAAGDIDLDGDLDIVAVSADGHHVVWLENPGTLSSTWKSHPVGGQIDPTKAWLDRIAVADFTGDGRLDIVATEERQDRMIAAHLYLFRSPPDPRSGRWERRVVGRHRSLNSMNIADIDGDGRPDIVVAEHTDHKDDAAPDNLTLIYLNRNAARSWIPCVVDRGPRSSHLGARLLDVDNDGFSEIVSIGWGQYRYVHLWKKISPGRIQ